MKPKKPRMNNPTAFANRSIITSKNIISPLKIKYQLILLAFLEQFLNTEIWNLNTMDKAQWFCIPIP